MRDSSKSCLDLLRRGSQVTKSAMTSDALFGMDGYVREPLSVVKHHIGKSICMRRCI